MSEEEKISLEKLKNMAYDINCIGAEYCKIDEEDMTCNKCLRCAYDTISNYINKLQKENEELKTAHRKNGRVLFTIEAINERYVSKEKIRTKIKELEDIKNKNIEYCSRDYFQLERTIKALKELLN